MDQTKRPLRIPPEFATYSERHGVFELYKRLMEQLLLSKPDDPIPFLIDLLKRDNDDVPQVIILGPPASGKHTIGKMVCNRLRTAHLTMKTLILEASNDLKRKAEDCVRKKEPIPTALWLHIIKERLKLFDCVKKGWVLEGFPQTREQAMALQAEGIYPKHFVILDAPDTVLIERAAGKRVDPKTGDVYHVTFDWPNNPEVESRLEEVTGNTEEEIIEQLIVYHRHIDGIMSSFEPVQKVINADQPKADVFSQVMTFLQSQPRSAAPHNPRIVLLGPTGSGKGVQAALLANKYNIVNAGIQTLMKEQINLDTKIGQEIKFHVNADMKVSCGQLVKQAIEDETKMGSAMKPYVSKNMMVPDALILSLLKDRLSQLDCVSRGWVIHGYPSTREQAEQLSGAGFIPNRVFFLDVPNDSVVERLTLRATDPITGDRYHMMYNPPRTQEVKDRLEVHTKDTDDAVRKRLSAYHAYVEEIADYYVDGQHINADQDPHTVFECIESMVVNPLPKHL